jgi:DNA primase
MAASIPQDFLDHLLSRIDIVDIIDRRVSLRKAGREYMACCPFHTEKTPSFTVSSVKQFYHCFGCGAHGTAIGFLMEYEHLGFLEAVEELAHSIGLEIPSGVSKGQKTDHDPLIDLLDKADVFFREQLKQAQVGQRARDYLRQRGVSDHYIQEFGIGYAPPGWENLLRTLTAKKISPKDVVKAGLVIEKETAKRYDRFRDRIMFPIRDRRGRTIAFGGRTLGDGAPKYLNSPETPVYHKSQELYGLYEARLRERHLPRLLVVEGYMDVLALVQHGISYTVATLGTAATAEHLQKLFRVTNEVIFCFDGDRAGRNAAWRALENALPLLKDGRQVSFLFLPEGEDPDSLVRKEPQQAFLERLNRATPLSDFFFEGLQTGVDTSSLDGRARFAERCRPLIHKLPDSLYRDMLIGRLTDITGIDKATVQQRFLAMSVAKGQPKPDTNAALSLGHYAIALLLYQVDLARQVSDDLTRFLDVKEPDLPLLVEVVESIRSNPHISHAAQLLMRYEGRKEGLILQKLAEWRPEIDDTLVEGEFVGVLEKLQKLHLERQFFDRIARGELSLDSEDINSHSLKI